jgi:drug/metabolite transporter (DMT)-like permease
MFWRILLLITGVFAGSTAVIMIKASQLHWAELSSYRLLVAAVVLAPIFYRDLRRHRAAFTQGHLLGAVAPGLLLGLHFFTWIVGARMTSPANASLIVNMVPIVLPFFLLALIRERLTAGEIGGVVLAVSGMALLTGSDAHVSSESMQGDLMCFGSMILYAAYLAFGRKNRHYPTVWLYLVPVYLVGGTFCLLISLGLTSPIHAYPPGEILLVLGLGIVPTVMGHSILNYAMRHLRGQVVGIANMGQFIFAGVLGWVFLGQEPTWALYLACVPIVAGAAMAIFLGPRKRKEKEAELEGEIGSAGSA